MVTAKKYNLRKMWKGTDWPEPKKKIVDTSNSKKWSGSTKSARKVRKARVK